MSERKQKLQFKNAAHFIDSAIGIFSPRTAFRRLQFRAGYDALDGTRMRKKRTPKLFNTTGDSVLDENGLCELREIARDMCRNNPLIKGLLQTERNGVVGSGTLIQARTDDKAFNQDVEQLWKEEMIDRPCDLSGRFSFNKILREMYLSYRRDGDVACIFTKQGLQPIEGDRIGTPIGQNDGKSFKISSGVASAKRGGKVVGYYIGVADKWGFIQPGTFKMYKAAAVYHMFNPDRFSFSRGEPALTSAIDAIDKITGYIDAELVAARVNACFTVFIARKGAEAPEGNMFGNEPSGTDEEGNRMEKINPGTIMYGEPDESATGIGQVRPGALFDPFVNRMLSIIGRPLLMPLMLVTLDFSGATFMNARIAYQKVQEAWEDEQNLVVKPFVSRTWRYFINRAIVRGDLKGYPEHPTRHDVTCNRWPYVDPFKEANADKIQLANKTTTRTIICARQGNEFNDVAEQMAEENKKLTGLGIAADPAKPPAPPAAPSKK